VKLAIVGGSPSTQMEAPFEDTSFDIWVLGNQLDQYEGRRVSRVFEIHDDLSEHDPKYPQWLVDSGLDLVVGDQFPLSGDNVSIYPESEVNELLNGCLSSSPAYMMGMAILKGYEEIHIYGVDMAIDNHEYFKQRPEMYAWIGLAKGMGINVVIPEKSSLFKGNYTEGRDWGKSKKLEPFSESEFSKMAEIHLNEVEKCRQDITELEYKLNAHDSARQVYERLAKVSRAVNTGVQVKTLTETVKVV